MPDATQNNGDMITLILAIVTAAGALLSAIAALRSAAAARVSADHAREVERRNILRDVLIAASETDTAKTASTMGSRPRSRTYRRGTGENIADHS
jgi:hypothetical protein